MNKKFVTWNLKCAVDGNYYTKITDSSTMPTVCPNNSAHAVDTGASEILSVSNVNGLQLNTEDGRKIVSPGLFPDYMNPLYTSEGDNYAAGTAGGGSRLVWSLANGSPETNTKTIQFNRYSQILGGFLSTNNTNKDDYFSVTATAPATATTVNGSGTGNCNKYPTGTGFNIILPAFGDGGHNVNLTEPMNAFLQPPYNRLVTKAVPITAVGGNDSMSPIGYWNWNYRTGAITPAPLGNGGYNLYDAPIPLSTYVNKMCVFSGSNTTPFVYKLMLMHRGGPFLPHWAINVTVTRAATHSVLDPAVYYGMTLVMARFNF